MKNFRITVNGNTYDVAVEELSGAQAAAPSAAPAPAPAPAAKPAPAKSAAAAGTKVTAPMPGKILKLNAKPGASVKKGDVLLTFEAMKMENEMTAMQDGVIEVVAVQVGSTFETGDMLLSIV